jgi:hypothetical protein
LQKQIKSPEKHTKPSTKMFKLIKKAIKTQKNEQLIIKIKKIIKQIIKKQTKLLQNFPTRIICLACFTYSAKRKRPPLLGLKLHYWLFRHRNKNDCQRRESQTPIEYLTEYWGICASDSATKTTFY